MTTKWLAEHPSALVFDCRWYYDGRSGPEAYQSGHIAGAQFAHMANDLSGEPGVGGASPLPTPAAFTATAERLGLHADSLVVTYDDAGGYTAGRLWWMLDSVGVEAYVLEGGIASWADELESGPHIDVGGGSLVVSEWPVDRFATADEVAAADDSTVVLDARGIENYTGTAGSQPRSGHIPGAVHASATDTLRDMRPLSVEQLGDRFAGLGVGSDTDVINYCGGGVSAGLNLLALRRIGHANARLYVGSWSDWGNDPTRPIETGPPST